ncbi:MAG: hypothetical protein FD155_941 [Bacteroidetes bacterium]|nr:MAG: hypothetical protein FD155_941 [Bacteroidota bacterium]
MKKNILSNSLVNRLILLFTIVYYAVSGSLNIWSLTEYRFISMVGMKYVNTSIYTEQDVFLYFLLESFLHIIILVALFIMWMKPKWLVLVTITIVSVLLGGIQFFVAGWNAYPRILFELVLLILIGISFSALVLSHLLRNKKSKLNTDNGKQEGLTTT